MMSWLVVLNSYHQLNLFHMQPHSGHPHINWRNCHSSASSGGTFQILNLAHCSVHSHLSASGFEMDNITRANAHCRHNCICSPTIHTPTVLISGCKAACDSWDLLSHCFASGSPTNTFSHKWLTEPRYQNKECFVNKTLKILKKKKIYLCYHL